MATIALEVLAMVLAYVTHVVLARLLGATEYGRYAFVVSFCVLCMVPLQLGYDIGFLRFLPAYRDEARHARARGFLRHAFALPTVLSVAIVLLVVASIFVFGWSETTYGPALIVGVLSLPLLVASSLCVHAGRGLGEFVAIKSAQDVLRPVLLLLAVTALWMIGDRNLSATTVLGISLAVVAVVVSLQLRLLVVRVRSVLKRCRPSYEHRYWLGICLPFLMTTATAVVMQQSDKLMIGLFRPAADVGVYAIAAHMSKLVTLSLVGANMLAAPMFAMLYARGDLASLQTLLRQLSHFIFWPSLAVVCALAWAGPWLLEWFGAAFAAGYAPLLILAVAGLVDVGVGSVGYLANMCNDQWAAVRIRLMAAVANVGLNAVLIPMAGIVGAAIATAASIAFANLWQHRRIARRLGVYADIVYACRRGAAGRR